MHKLTRFVNEATLFARGLLMACFWFGVLMIVLGSFITFIPGGEQSWFAMGAGLLTAGLLLPGWKFRIAALLLIAFSVSAALDGRRHGIEYRARLQSRLAPLP